MPRLLLRDSPAEMHRMTLSALCGLCTDPMLLILLQLVGGSRRLQFFDSYYRFLGSVNLTQMGKAFNGVAVQWALGDKVLACVCM